MPDSGTHPFDSLLDTLKKSILFSSDFPRRMRHSHAEWASLGEEGRLWSLNPGLVAIGRVWNVRDLADSVNQLGEARHTAAVPLLAELWADCALVPVRNAAGHALRAMGTPEARNALLDLIEDADHLSVYLAVTVVFDEDAATAFDRFAHYFEPGRVAQPGGGVIPDAVLDTFAPHSFVAGRNRQMMPQWADSRAPSWLRQDPRWVRLCVALRHDNQLGRAARCVLRYAAPDLVAPALEEAQAREGPRVVRIAIRADRHLLARYLRGEYVPVWNELRAHEALGGDLHKADVSGGDPYGIELPFAGADPVFANEAHELPFVDYLRLCFHWAGFPRLERYAGQPDIPEFLEAMSKELEPF